VIFSLVVQEQTQQARPLTLCEVEIWSPECAPCPAGASSLPGSKLHTDCQCNAGWVGVNGDACVQCGPGTYKADPLTCVGCPPGASSAAGSSECECNPGWAVANGSACVQCGAGTYKGGVGPGLCLLCPPDLTSPAGSTVIAACQCFAGWFGQPGAPCVQCPRNLTSPAGSTVIAACQCFPGWSEQPGAECVLCAAGKYRQSNFGYNWARSCGAARTDACPTAQSSTLLNGDPGRAVDGNSAADFGGESCTYTESGLMNWWSVTLGDTPILVTGLRMRGREDCCDGRTEGYSIHAGNDLTAAGRLQNNAVCVPAVAGRALTRYSADNLVCQQPIYGRIVIFSLVVQEQTQQARPLTLCEVEIWSPECAPCPAGASSLPGSTMRTDCQCNAGWVGANGDACTQCGPGTYKADPLTCVGCPSGASSAAGSSECVPCAAGKYRSVLPEFDWARSCGAARNTGCATAQSSGSAGDANAVWTPQSCTHTSNSGVNWWSVTLGETAVHVSGLRVRGRAHGAQGYSVYIGNDTTAAGMFTENALCVAGVAGADVAQFLPVDLLCGKSITGRILVFRVPADYLTLCDVEIWSSECAPCPANSDSRPGSDERTDCQCPAGFTGSDEAECSQCAAGKYSNANTWKDWALSCGAARNESCPTEYNWARSCGAARNEACPTAQIGTALNGLSQRAVDGNVDAAWGGSSCTQTFNQGGMNWWRVTLGTDPVVVSGLRVRGNNDGFYYATSKGYSVYVGNDLTPAGMFANNTVCVPSVAGRALKTTSADDLTCDQPISGRHVIFTVTNTRLILCEVEIWSRSRFQQCISCPANYGSLAGSSGCVCSPGWTWSDAGQCVPCEAGTYKPTLGTEPCLPCPAKSTSPVGSTVITACRCLARFGGEPGAACVLCAAGKYSSVLSAQCAPCPADSSSLPGSDERSDCQCNAGWTVSDGAVCAQCVAGKYRQDISSQECAPCPANTGSLPGSSGCVCSPAWTLSGQCVPCEAGTYKPTLGTEPCLPCPANSDSLAMSTLITACQCNVGWYHADGPFCDTCAPGKYVRDSLSCVNCEAGKYGTTVNAVSCMDCPPDTGSVGIGATRCGCFPGFGGDLCAACAGDTYKDSFGMAECTACPASSSIASPKNTAVGDCACSSDRYRVAVPD